MHELLRGGELFSKLSLRNLVVVRQLYYMTEAAVAASATQKRSNAKKLKKVISANITGLLLLCKKANIDVIFV